MRVKRSVGDRLVFMSVGGVVGWFSGVMLLGAFGAVSLLPVPLGMALGWRLSRHRRQ
jgi:hypothetical protein